MIPVFCKRSANALMPMHEGAKTEAILVAAGVHGMPHESLEFLFQGRMHGMNPGMRLAKLLSYLLD